MMRKLTLLLFLLLGTAKLHAQLDTLFWFVAPEVAQSHGDRPIVFRFASLATPATITISQPANPGFPVQTINLGPNA
ncbi:MAG: gliding motility-associated C-terminal domain-containing protein, partial [Bacteroidota bacterium]